MAERWREAPFPCCTAFLPFLWNAATLPGNAIFFFFRPSLGEAPVLLAFRIHFGIADGMCGTLSFKSPRLAYTGSNPPRGSGFFLFFGLVR